MGHALILSTLVFQHFFKDLQGGPGIVKGSVPVDHLNAKVSNQVA